MLIADALSLRKDMKARLGRQSQYLHQVGVVYKDDDGNYPDVAKEIQTYLDMSAKYVSLVSNINDTNQTVFLDDGMTLAQGLVLRDRLVYQADTFQKLANLSRRSEEQVMLIDGAKCKLMGDDFARQARELDNQIQAKNFTMELREKY